MKHILLFLFMATLLFPLQAQEKTETISVLGDFNSISVYAGIEVNLIKSKENKIVLSDKNDDTSVFGYKIKNNTLKLRAGIDKKLSLGNIFVDVYYRNDIDELKLFQGSKVFLKDTINQTNLKIKVKEGSLLVGIVNTERSTIEVFSGGSVSIKGESSVVEIKSSTGGICSAEELSSKQTIIHASIGSVVHSTASTLMHANATTGAIIRVYGSPKKLITNTRLGGSIKYIK